MTGFWSTETLRQSLPELIEPYEECHIKNCAYELTVGDQSYVTSSDDDQTKVRIKLDRGVVVNILPGQLALLVAREYVKMPPSAIGLLSMKSKFKMRGLVNVSGFHVDPGYEGRLVFAVFNAGSIPIVFKQNEPAFLLWYASLDSATDDIYRGSRAELTDITEDQIMNLKGPTYNPTALADRVASLENRRDWWRMIGVALIGGIIMLILGTAFDIISFNLAVSSGT